jgi:hypothetical protein
MSDGLGTSALTLQMLEWLAERPRTYGETLEAWKTSCPRLTIWEDALTEGLVRVERGAVVLTHAGVAVAQKLESRTPDTIAASTSAATTSR